jgi:hypothetical protein
MARTGRPTILNDDLVNQAWEYLDNCSEVSNGSLLPTIEGLALSLHCHRDTLYSWAEENTDFSDILEELKQAQAQKLMQNGLYNRYNPTIAKLLLSKHGYIEQKDVTSGGEKLESGSKLSPEEIDAQLTELLDRRQAKGNPPAKSAGETKG